MKITKSTAPILLAEDLFWGTKTDKAYAGGFAPHSRSSHATPGCPAHRSVVEVFCSTKAICTMLSRFLLGFKGKHRSNASVSLRTVISKAGQRERILLAFFMRNFVLGDLQANSISDALVQRQRQIYCTEGSLSFFLRQAKSVRVVGHSQHHGHKGCSKPDVLLHTGGQKWGSALAGHGFFLLSL